MQRAARMYLLSFEKEAHRTSRGPMQYAHGNEQPWHSLLKVLKETLMCLKAKWKDSVWFRKVVKGCRKQHAWWGQGTCWVKGLTSILVYAKRSIKTFSFFYEGKLISSHIQKEKQAWWEVSFELSHCAGQFASGSLFFFKVWVASSYAYDNQIMTKIKQ